MRLLPVLTLLLLCLPNSGEALELQEVLDNTMIAPPARVGFREARYNEMFMDSLVLTGHLEYLGDGHLRKVIETPFQETFLVKADRIEIQREGEVKLLSVYKSRSLRIMLEGIEAILAGQTERVEKIFSYELSGTDSDWSLRLTPRSRRVAKKLLGLTVTGNDESVLTIRVDLSGGEWHQMEINRASEDS